MAAIRVPVDPWSAVVIVITLVLFVAALFIKGLTHDMLIEAAVFLVSVKLIMMNYKSRVGVAEIKGRLDDVQEALARMERLLASRRE